MCESSWSLFLAHVALSNLTIILSSGLVASSVMNGHGYVLPTPSELPGWWLPPPRARMDGFGDSVNHGHTLLRGLVEPNDNLPRTDAFVR